MDESEFTAAGASFAFPGQESGSFGREELRAYAFVYAVLASTAQRGAARGTLVALEAVLSDLRFSPGEPETSSALSGYSERGDVLWFRPHKVIGAANARAESRRARSFLAEVRENRRLLRDEGIPSATSVFSEGRSMDRLFHGFVGSKVWNEWQLAPVSVSSDAFPRREAYFLLAGKHARAVFPFRGSLVVGRAGHGVVFLGVRQQEWLAGCSSEVRTRWLRSSPDLCRRVTIPSGSPMPLTPRSATSLRDILADDAYVYWHAARNLLQWHFLPRPDPWRCRIGVRCPSRFEWFERLRLGQWLVAAMCVSDRRPFQSFRTGQVRSFVRRGDGLPAVVLVTDGGAEAVERAVDGELVKNPDEMARVHLWVVDASAVERLVERYPWCVMTAYAVSGDVRRYGSLAILDFVIAKAVEKADLTMAVPVVEALLSVPKRDVDPWIMKPWITTLVDLLAARPWDLVRALYLLFRQDCRAVRVRGRKAVPAERVAYWADQLPKQLLSETKRSPWADGVPEPPEHKWWALVRLLSSWCAAGRADVAANVASEIRKRVERGGGAGGSIEEAWNVASNRVPRRRRPDRKRA